MATLKTLFDDMAQQLADAARPLGVWAPLPAALVGEPLLFRFMDALAPVELTGDRSADLDALTTASERFGATLDLDRRVWWTAAAEAVSMTADRGIATRLSNMGAVSRVYETGAEPVGRVP